MIIDAHTHIYPEKIAEKATAGTDAFYNTKAVFNGTVFYLLEDGAKAGIDHFLVQSVATAPKQVSSINRFIARSVQESGGKMTGLGTLHPYSEHLEEDVEELIGLGLIGVKLHPDIQRIPVDDPHCMEIYELCRGRLPILMHTGGNCGSQSSVTVIRSLSLDELKFGDIFRVMWKEFRTAILCGATLAVVCFVKILLVDRLLMGNTSINLLVDGVVCLTLGVTVVIAKFVGCSLPLLAKRLGFDPAVMASPFITTIVDALSLLVYFMFSKTLLGL